MDLAFVYKKAAINILGFGKKAYGMDSVNIHGRMEAHIMGFSKMGSSSI